VLNMENTPLNNDRLLMDTRQTKMINFVKRELLQGENPLHQPPTDVQYDVYDYCDLSDLNKEKMGKLIRQGYKKEHLISEIRKHDTSTLDGLLIM
jgi:hypothetical protein